MEKPKTIEETYEKCNLDGCLIKINRISMDKIDGMYKLAMMDLNSVKILVNALNSDSGGWNSIYKLYYDVLHILCEAYIHLDGYKSRNHLCLFAFICMKHPELELNWNFFQKVRTKRNGICYYGKPVKYEDWKEIELQMNLYINLLRKEIEKKLKDFD